MCDFKTWPWESPEWTSAVTKHLVKKDAINIPHVKLEKVEEKSDNFPIEFPIESVRCKTLKSHVPKDVLERNINSAYPLVHEKALQLYIEFLSHKLKFGSSIEKLLYKDMTLEMLVDRLLNKRAVVFFGFHDRSMLIDGFGRVGNWESIGQSGEKPPLILQNCLSYDEIKLSALLSVSSYTYFVNEGDRDNCGKTSPNRTAIEDEGIVIGLIGPRFEKRGVMEYQEIVVTKDQNVQENGYGDHSEQTLQGLFLNFYGKSCLTYEEEKKRFKNTQMFTKIRDGQYFNNVLYSRRLALSIDTLLIDSNKRAQEVNKKGYIHVVGIGLGVWKISEHQNSLFMETFCQRIQFLGNKMQNISDICFSYINHPSCGKYQNGEIIPIPDHPLNGIKIHIFDRNPHERLSGPNRGKLLVVSYAWDGNSLPGNEFWMGMLAASGDPACASSTQVAELHNPHINPKVCGANLKIVTLDGDVIALDEFYERIKQN